MLTATVNLMRNKNNELIPESVEIFVKGGKRQPAFRIKHSLAVLGFDKETKRDKEEVANRVKSLLNLIK